MSFVLTQAGGLWSVLHGRGFVTFQDRSDALAAAIDAAHVLGEVNDQPATVTIQTGDNHFQTVWVFGKDHHPGLSMARRRQNREQRFNDIQRRLEEDVA
jgi:hypothetical protein